MGAFGSAAALAQSARALDHVAEQKSYTIVVERSAAPYFVTAVDVTGDVITAVHAMK